MIKQTQNKTKIDWKRLTISAIESGLRKAIEVVIIALVAGAAMKFVLASIPAALVATVITKLVKIQMGA